MMVIDGGMISLFLQDLILQGMQLPCGLCRAQTRCWRCCFAAVGTEVGEIGLFTFPAIRNKCIATSNKCLTSSNKKLLETSASLLVPSALLVVTRSY